MMTPAQKDLMRRVVETTDRQPPGRRVLVPTARLAHLNTITACVKRGWLKWAGRTPGSAVELTIRGRAVYKSATFVIRQNLRGVRPEDLPTLSDEWVAKLEDAKVRARANERANLRGFEPFEQPMCRSIAEPIGFDKPIDPREELAAKVRAYFEAVEAMVDLPNTRTGARFVRVTNALKAAVGLKS